MKKIISLVLVFLVFFAVCAIASAAGLKNDVSVAQTEFGPMLIKTLKGTELTGLNHKGLSIVEEKEKKGGISCSNSKKELENLIVLNKKSVKPFLLKLQRQNEITANQAEGPLFKVELYEEQPNEVQAEKLTQLGFEEPQILKVYSGKKAKPNMWGGLLLKVIGFIL